MGDDRSPEQKRADRFSTAFLVAPLIFVGVVGVVLVVGWGISRLS